MEEQDQGSYGGGFLLGFLLGLIGLIIAVAINKHETNRGAIAGFLVSLGIAVVIVICYFVVFAGAISSLY